MSMRAGWPNRGHNPSLIIFPRLGLLAREPPTQSTKLLFSCPSMTATSQSCIVCWGEAWIAYGRHGRWRWQGIGHKQTSPTGQRFAKFQGPKSRAFVDWELDVLCTRVVLAHYEMASFVSSRRRQDRTIIVALPFKSCPCLQSNGMPRRSRSPMSPTTMGSKSTSLPISLTLAVEVEPCLAKVQRGIPK